MRNKLLITALSSTLVLTSLISTSQVSAQEMVKVEMKENKKEMKINEIKSKIRSFDEQITKQLSKIKKLKSHIDELSKEKRSLITLISNLEKKISEHRGEFDYKVNLYQHADEEWAKLDSIMSAKSVKAFFQQLTSKSNESEDKELILNFMQMLAELEDAKEDLRSIEAELSEYEEELNNIQIIYKKTARDKDKLLAAASEKLTSYEMEKKEEEKLLNSQSEIKEKEKKSKEKKRPNREELRETAVGQLKEKIQTLKTANEDPNSYENFKESASESDEEEPVVDFQEVVKGGLFIKPATGSFTSHFGRRWGTLHAGVDIGKNGRAGDVPIAAAASGEVIRAYYSTSYGNVVFLRHNLNGKAYTTVYAHMERFNVSVGQKLKQGQVLGVMGNTGYSTGPHLHFEIHQGDWNINKSNAIDPLKFIK